MLSEEFSRVLALLENVGSGWKKGQSRWTANQRKREEAAESKILVLLEKSMSGRRGQMQTCKDGDGEKGRDDSTLSVFPCGGATAF